MPLRPDASLENLNRRTGNNLPGWFGLKVVAVSEGRLVMEAPIKPEFLRLTVSCTRVGIAVADLRRVGHMRICRRRANFRRLLKSMFCVRDDGTCALMHRRHQGSPRWCMRPSMPMRTTIACFVARR